MKKILIPILVIIIAIVVYFLFAMSNSRAVSQVSDNAQSQNSAAAPILPKDLPKNVQPPATPAFVVPLVPDMIVDMKDYKYSPATITVKVGTKITWTNHDTVSHTVTSDTGSLLDSKTIEPGKYYSHVFTAAGTTTYHCTIHPNMKGTVIVNN